MLSNKELEVIYRVDRIRDENHSLEDLLESAVKELDEVIMADKTFVMLYKVALLSVRGDMHDINLTIILQGNGIKIDFASGIVTGLMVC